MRALRCGFSFGAATMVLLMGSVFRASAAFDPADLFRFQQIIQGSGAFGGAFNSVAFGNGRFVAVGRGAEGGLISSSSNGLDWTTVLSDANVRSFSEITFGGGLFLAVGGSDAWASVDGLGWDRRDVGQASGLVVAAYGNGTYLVGTEGGRFSTSEDGLRWSAATNKLPSTPRSLTFGNGRFILLAGTDLLSSLNGTHWTPSLGVPGHQIDRVQFAEGVFFATGLGLKWTSQDGVEWVQQGSQRDERFAAVTANDGRFVALGYGGSLGLTAFLSLDAKNWSRKIVLPLRSLPEPIALAAGNGIFVAVGGALSNPFVTISTNGFDWRMVTPGVSGRAAFQAVSYGEGRFVVLDDLGTVFTSPDARAWKVIQAETGVALTPRRSIFGLGKFVAVGWNYYQIFQMPGSNPGIGGAVLVSEDGETWSNFRVEEPLNGVACGLDQFVAAGERGVIFTSPDGIGWKRQVSGTTNTLAQVVWGGNAWIAVGEQGTILRSVDGVIWTEERSNTPDGLQGGIYAQDHFVVVSRAGAILTSPDGIVWTTQTTFPDASLSDITFGNDAYVAVAGTQVLVSVDRVHWSTQPLPGGCCGGRVAYGDGKFIVTGQSLRIADVTRPLVGLTGLGGQADLLLAGRVGGVYEIETSRDLSFPAWSPMALITNRQITTQLRIGLPNDAQRFYRARWVPF